MDAPPSPDLDAPFRAHLAGRELRRAAEWIVKRYADDVLGLCTAMVRDRAVAEDLAQDAFGRAFAGLGEFRGESSARTWLLAIARNRCLDHLRHARRDPWAGVPPDDAEPDTHADDAPLPHERVSSRDDIEAALDALAEGERALVVLRYRHGLEYSELAVAFGLREGTVRMRISRALSRMRDALLARDAVAPSAAEVMDSLESAHPFARPGGAAPPPARPGTGAPPALPAAASAAPQMAARRSIGSAPIPRVPSGAPAPAPAPRAVAALPPPRRPALPAWIDQLTDAVRRTAIGSADVIRARLLSAAAELPSA